MPVMAPFTQPAWPLLDYAICWAAGPNQSPVQNYWSDVTGRTEGTVQVTRGKIYELDQVQPGQATLSLRNDDSVFDPDNSGSPFWPQVLPYRLARIRAQLPVTVNLLTADQATAFYASKGSGGAGSTLPQWVGSVTGSTVTIGYNGTLNYYQVPAANAFETVAFFGFSVKPGQVYTGQCEANCSTGVTAEIALCWVDVNGNQISVVGGGTTTSASGAVITVTATAPSNAAGAVLYVQNNAAVAGGAVFNVWNVQLEAAASASAWVQPGTWYSLFTGYVERWPESWSSGGAYGTVDLTLVDYFAFLAQRPMLDPFTMDLLALSPNFLYQLNEANGATTFVDASGNRAAATLVQTNVLGTINPGQTPAAADNAPQGADFGVALTGTFLGAAGPVLGSAATDAAATYIGIPPNSAGVVGPPRSGGFTRLCACRFTGMVSGASAQPGGFFEAETPAGTVAEYGFWAAFNGDFYLDAYANDGTNSMLLHLPGLGPIAQLAGVAPNQYVQITDQDWHLIGMSLSADGKTLTGWCDSAAAATMVSGTALNIGEAYNVQFDLIAGDATYFVGQVAHVTEFGFVLTVAQWQSLASCWRNGHAGERSDQRYARILAWAGYTGPSSVQAGSSVDYGPATDVAGKSALSALQTVVDTEAGQHFVAADGTIVFQARTNRYNPASTLAFGENSGEVPYQSAQFDFDPTRVANDIQITGTFGRSMYRVIDTSSQNDYGQFGLQRDVNSLDPNELQDAAEYLAYQNAQPATRLEQLPVDVGSNPALWANLLPLDLGACVTVNRRPPAGTTKQVVGFLEQIVWQLADDRTCTWTAQISPAARHYFAQFDSTTYGAFDSMVFGY